MGKNGGGKPTDKVLTLEEALMRFKRKREVGLESMGEGASEPNVHHTDSSTMVRRERAGTTELDLSTVMADDSASESAHGDETNAEMSASNDIVAVIEGIPRTLEELERIASAENAYAEDFPETGLEMDEVDDSSELDDGLEIGDPAIAAVASRHALIRDYAFTAMGSALMVLVAFLMTRVPIVSHRTNLLMANSVATPALKASTLMSQDEMITTLVTVPPDADVREVSAVEPSVPTDALEERIRDTLKV
ncbi:MAG TPA: hypothetical protein VE243_08800, partial [Candidatus Acidoferrum sp.]|nr:hypothetical protein [Candidatus Acidoferrum sp.]